MPDLPDELAALLRERADRAPVPAAPTDEVVRAVRRRQAFRAGAAVSGTALALAAVVGVAAAVVPDGRQALPPAAPGPGSPAPETPGPVTAPGGERPACAGELRVHIDADVPRFDKPAYTVPAGADCIWAEYRGTLRHELVLRYDDGAVTWGAMPLDASGRGGFTISFGKNPLSAGSYELLCTIHPDMRTAVEVR